jgi:hypothetical protein
MRVGEGFAEPKKVRCSGCGTVILLTPDPANPSDVKISFPKKSDKKNEGSETRKRILLYSAFGAACLFLAFALWWTFR